MSSPQRIMALDLGAKRVGVALGDTAHGVASPWGYIPRQNRDQLVAAIGQLAQAEGVELIVVGLPECEGANPAAERARNFAERLRRRLDLPVALCDESTTTVEAHEALIASGHGRARRKELVDATAASLILRAYLDGLREDQP